MGTLVSMLTTAQILYIYFFSQFNSTWYKGGGVANWLIIIIQLPSWVKPILSTPAVDSLNNVKTTHHLVSTRICIFS